jgi:hypothetical protein
MARQIAIEQMRLWHSERDATLPTRTERLAVVARAVTQLHRQSNGCTGGQWGIKDDEIDAGWGDAPVHHLPPSRYHNSTTVKEPGAPQLRGENQPRHKVAVAVLNRDIWPKDSQTMRHNDDRGAHIIVDSAGLLMWAPGRRQLAPTISRSARARCGVDSQPNRLMCTTFGCIEHGMSIEDDAGTEDDEYIVIERIAPVLARPAPRKDAAPQVVASMVGAPSSPPPPKVQRAGQRECDQDVGLFSSLNDSRIFYEAGGLSDYEEFSTENRLDHLEFRKENRTTEFKATSFLGHQMKGLPSFKTSEAALNCDVLSGCAVPTQVVG